MSQATPQDLRDLLRHRAIWAARPELREVYGEFFRRLLIEVADRGPILEVGAGPGFLKESSRRVISTDVVPSPWIDGRCDATRLPFRTGSLGGIVALDVIHHLPRPLEFLKEAGRVLGEGGRLAAIEPWISPASWWMYRWFHHEDCSLPRDLDRPFEGEGKEAMVGNCALPYALVKAHPLGYGELRAVRREPFLALPYLSTLGFRRERPMPRLCLSIARAMERALGPARRVAATRILLVWERAGAPQASLAGSLPSW